MKKKNHDPAGVKDYLISIGISAEQLAKKIGFSATYLRAVIHGEQRITERLYLALKDYFRNRHKENND